MRATGKAVSLRAWSRGQKAVEQKAVLAKLTLDGSNTHWRPIAGECPWPGENRDAHGRG